MGWLGGHLLILAPVSMPDANLHLAVGMPALSRRDPSTLPHTNSLITPLVPFENTPFQTGSAIHRSKAGVLRCIVGRGETMSAFAPVKLKVRRSRRLLSQGGLPAGMQRRGKADIPRLCRTAARAPGLVPA